MKHLFSALLLCVGLSACGMHYTNDKPRAGTMERWWDYEQRDPKKHVDNDAWDRDMDGRYDDWSYHDKRGRY
jgi:hypothetical protein